jgi:hypothetical protein
MAGSVRWRYPCGLSVNGSTERRIYRLVKLINLGTVIRLDEGSGEQRPPEARMWSGALLDHLHMAWQVQLPDDIPGFRTCARGWCHQAEAGHAVGLGFPVCARGCLVNFWKASLYREWPVEGLHGFRRWPLAISGAPGRFGPRLSRIRRHAALLQEHIPMGGKVGTGVLWLIVGARMRQCKP